MGDLGCNETQPRRDEWNSLAWSLLLVEQTFLNWIWTYLHTRQPLPPDSTFDAQALHEKFAKNMDYTKLKGAKFGLLKVLVRTLWVPLLLPIPPRAALIAFYFCQPLFIESLIKHLSHPEPDSNVDYGLIGAAVFIYSGIVISYAVYWYYHHRLRTMVRSILVTETTMPESDADCGCRRNQVTSGPERHYPDHPTRREKSLFAAAPAAANPAFLLSYSNSLIAFLLPQTMIKN
ncbi:hypothetical protein BDV19DRAFT_67207 [Aspergillus venezuelensis]